MVACGNEVKSSPSSTVYHEAEKIRLGGLRLTLIYPAVAQCLVVAARDAWGKSEESWKSAWEELP